LSVAVRGDATPWQDDAHPNKGWAKNLEPGQECFYCWQVIHDIGLFWMGNGSDLWLHPDCFMRLTMRLMRDAWDIDCKLPNEISSMFGVRPKI